MGYLLIRKSLYTFLLYLICINCQIEVFSRCENGFQLIFIENLVNFDSAELICSNINSTLVSIPDSSTFQQVQNFMLNNSLNFETWIGLRRPNNEDPFRPSSFEFLDGSSFIDNFGQVRGEEPWKDLTPGELVNVNQNEQCVEIDGSLNSFWNDNLCSRERSTLCKRDCGIEITDNNEEKTRKLDDFSLIIGCLMMFCSLILMISLITLQFKQKLYKFYCLQQQMSY